MAKLKSLRASVGAYGRVAAGGIIEVEEKDVKKLTDTHRFVPATETDIETAQKAQAEHLKVAVVGAGASFAPMPPVVSPAENEVITLKLQADAEELEGVMEGLKAETERLQAFEASLQQRQETVEAGEADLALKRQKLEEEISRLQSRADEVQAQEVDLAARIKEADEAEIVRKKAADDEAKRLQDLDADLKKRLEEGGISLNEARTAQDAAKSTGKAKP